MINDKIIKELSSSHLFLNYMDEQQFNQVSNIVRQVKALKDFQDFNNLIEPTIDIIGEIVRENGKQELYKYLLQLSIVEYNTRDFRFSKRDHVIHSLLTFLVGMYINEFFMRENKCGVDGDFQWKITALFHDIGYAYAISNDIAFKQDRKVYEIINNITGSKNEINILNYYDKYSQLNQNKNAFDLIFGRLNEWDLDVNRISEYIDKLKYITEEDQMNIDHGVMSALVLLYTLDQVYQNFNPNREHGFFYKEVIINGKSYDLNFSQDIFENDIIDICSAIFIHSMKKTCFENRKIDANKARLAYLLKLSDEIQDWNRLEFLKETSNSQELYDITVDNQKLKIRCKLGNFKNKIDDYLSPEGLIINA